MASQTIPPNQWDEFLRSFASRHYGWIVSIETHDRQTGEIVTSRFMPLESVELDLEDGKNKRINVIVHGDEQEIKHVLFGVSDLSVQLSHSGNDEGLRIVSLHTVTMVRLRVAAAPELVDGVA